MNILKRFPKQFVWGTATSAYQIEGAANQDGKGPSIWDTFCLKPGNIVNGENANIACDHYTHYAEDIALIASLGVSAYRLSISWSRIMPNGTKDSINQQGVDFYNRLLDECLANSIDPWVTLYHWDLPESLYQEHVSNFFADYAELCFDLFGDRVKNWITINEAWVVSVLGYGQGVFAPGHKSSSEPYQVGHNLLLAHAKAVKIYRDRFQSVQGGRIGISNNCDWREPLSNSTEDKAAAQLALEFFLGWFADPIYLGDYPESMKKNVGDRLPKFSEEERQLVYQSSDFFGLNHYTTMYAAKGTDDYTAESVYGNGGLNQDQGVNLSVDKNWPITNMQWAVVPWGCRKQLEWIAERYNNPEIVITENGCAYQDEIVNGEVDDQLRIDFYTAYLEECANALDKGVNLTGYFAWSFMDNFEWAQGYDKRFGLYYVDFDTGKRTAKASAKWFTKLLQSE